MSNKVVVNVDTKSPRFECGQMFIKNGDPLSLDDIRKCIIKDGLMHLGNVKITIDKM